MGHTLNRKMGPWTTATFLRDTCAREAQGLPLSSHKLGPFSVQASRPHLDNHRRPACSAPLIRSPISRLLGAPIGPVAADLFLLRRLDRRHIGPRHAGVAPLVAGMSL